jgi:hypothetical protein
MRQPIPPVCDLHTMSTILPVVTVDTDFTFEFAVSQGIVTSRLGNHSN